MNPYDLGILAAKEGKYFFENPYSTGCDANYFNRWFAGWCFEKNRIETEERKLIDEIMDIIENKA